ncbi:MAG: hypothetical protein ABIN80_10450 [Dyadobacter sp.]
MSIQSTAGKMKVHTTNYHDAFIQVADDSPARAGENFLMMKNWK